MINRLEITTNFVLKSKSVSAMASTVLISIFTEKSIKHMKR